MSNTYAETTGVVLFEGEPVITEGLRAWLSPMFSKQGLELLSPEDTYLNIAGAGPGIALYYEDDMDLHVVDLENAMRLALVHKGMAAAEVQGWDAPKLLDSLGSAYGQEKYVQELIGEQDLEDLSLGMEQIVEMAMRFGDGHNVRAVLAYSGMHSDKVRLWSFGGWGDMVVRDSAGTIRRGCISPMWSMKSLLAHHLAPEDRRSTPKAVSDFATEMLSPKELLLFADRLKAFAENELAGESADAARADRPRSGE